MTRTAGVVATTDLRTVAAWRSFAIPDGDPTVDLATLHEDVATGATTALVRFPSGWSRPIAGHYLAAEDFVVLSGDLRVDDTAFVAGDWGFFARGHCRADSRAGDDGAVALAWFDRVPRWVSGGHHVPERPAAHRALTEELSDIDLACPVDDPGTRLRRDPAVDLWLTDGIDAHQRHGRPCQILSLPSWTWVRLAAGEPTPRLEGPCVLRMENR